MKLLLTELSSIVKDLKPLNKQVKELDDRKKEVNVGIGAWLEASGVDDDVEIRVGEALVKRKRIFNAGSGPYDYERITVKDAPISQKQVIRKTTTKAKKDELS